MTADRISCVPAIKERVDDIAAEWFGKSVSGRMSGADCSALEAWLAADRRHRGAFLRVQAIWKSLDVAGAIEPREMHEGLWPTKNPALSPGKVSRRILIATAASAAGLVIAAQHSLRATSTLQTVRGEFRKIPLPDHSIANLNTTTKLEVDMADATRRIDLISGEAWFEVAKNPHRPFVVEVGDVRVVAVGTAFAVRRKDSGADVLVTEGVVEVWNRLSGLRRNHLRAGERAFVKYTPDDFVVQASPEDVENRLAWRNGSIVLHNDTVQYAIMEFNRYNAQQIVVTDPAVGSAKLAGVYKLDDPAQFASAIQKLFGVPVDFTRDMIVIGPST